MADPRRAVVASSLCALIASACGANVVFQGDGAGGSGATSTTTFDGVPAGGRPSTSDNMTSGVGGAPPHFVCAIEGATTPECQSCSDGAASMQACGSEVSACGSSGDCATYASCILNCNSNA